VASLLILYTSPYTDYFWSGFSEEFQAQMHKDATDLAARYGIPCFDYSEDPRFCLNMDYFEDVDHMNLEGSKALVPVLLEDIDAFYNESKNATFGAFQPIDKALTISYVFRRL